MRAMLMILPRYFDTPITLIFISRLRRSPLFAPPRATPFLLLFSTFRRCHYFFADAVFADIAALIITLCRVAAGTL